jgi:hypothetical protein
MNDKTKNNFDCNACGTCCKMFGKTMDIHGTKVEHIPLDLFPYKWDETGKCEMLVDNKCSVYETRPNTCRWQWGFDMGFFGNLTLEQAVEVNKKACIELRRFACAHH